jgi:hypothetical protein
MALANPSFEDAGSLPADAAHWTLSARTSREAIAAFGASPPQAFESFERWSSFVDALAGVTTVIAFFDSGHHGFEDFEHAWANSLYLREFQPAVLVPLHSSATETFDANWSGAAYFLAWGAVASDAATFGAHGAEDFEARWHANESFEHDLAAIATDAARFAPGALAFEPFETAWVHATTL